MMGHGSEEDGRDERMQCLVESLERALASPRFRGWKPPTLYDWNDKFLVEFFQDNEDHTICRWGRGGSLKVTPSLVRSLTRADVLGWPFEESIRQHHLRAFVTVAQEAGAPPRVMDLLTRVVDAYLSEVRRVAQQLKTDRRVSDWAVLAFVQMLEAEVSFLFARRGVFGEIPHKEGRKLLIEQVFDLPSKDPSSRVSGEVFLCLIHGFQRHHRGNYCPVFEETQFGRHVAYQDRASCIGSNVAAQGVAQGLHHIPWNTKLRDRNRPGSNEQSLLEQVSALQQSGQMPGVVVLNAGIKRGAGAYDSSNKRQRISGSDSDDGYDGDSGQGSNSSRGRGRRNRNRNRRGRGRGGHSGNRGGDNGQKSHSGASKGGQGGEFNNSNGGSDKSQDFQ
jgi:hypothetical protein